jgi:nucleotide-binding universal stress UspA family protein
MRIRRILVALDASPHSLAALDAATELAVNLGAELSGLFVEDVNLLRLAQLPFSKEMDFMTQSSRSLDRAYLERQLRVQASRMRRALAERAEHSQVPWSFGVARGAITSELLKAAAEADLTILGKSGWSLTRGRRLGSTTRAVLLQTDRLTLVLQQGARLGLPVLVLYDGSAAALRGLNAATRFFPYTNGDLTVLVLADAPAAAQDLQTQVTKWLGERGLQARYRWLIGPTVGKLVHLVQEEGCRFVVLPSPSLGLSDAALQSLLEKVDCPLLWVR